MKSRLTQVFLLAIFCGAIVLLAVILGIIEICKEEDRVSTKAVDQANQEELQVAMQTADQVVQRYLELIANGEWQSLKEVLHFSNEADLKHFQDVLARLKQMPWVTGSGLDMTKEIHLTGHPDDMRGGIYQYLVPNAGEYIAKEFELVSVPNKGLMIEYPKPQFDHILDAESRALSVEAALDEWKTLQGDALTRKADRYKESVRLHLKMIKYAEENKLEIFPGFDPEQVNEEYYEAIKNMSPEELRRKLVDKAEAELKDQD